MKIIWIGVRLLFHCCMVVDPYSSDACSWLLGDGRRLSHGQEGAHFFLLMSLVEEFFNRLMRLWAQKSQTTPEMKDYMMRNYGGREVSLVMGFRLAIFSRETPYTIEDYLFHPNC